MSLPDTDGLYTTAEVERLAAIKVERQHRAVVGRGWLFWRLTEAADQWWASERPANIADDGAQTQTEEGRQAQAG